MNIIDFIYLVAVLAFAYITYVLNSKDINDSFKKIDNNEPIDLHDPNDLAGCATLLIVGLGSLMWFILLLFIIIFGVFYYITGDIQYVNNIQP